MWPLSSADWEIWKTNLTFWKKAPLLILKICSPTFNFQLVSFGFTNNWINITEPIQINFNSSQDHWSSFRSNGVWRYDEISTIYTFLTNNITTFSWSAVLWFVERRFEENWSLSYACMTVMWKELIWSRSKLLDNLKNFEGLKTVEPSSVGM